VNINALPWSRAIRLLRRGKSHRLFADSVSKRDTK
jgi:hypothetical protein